MFNAQLFRSLSLSMSSPCASQRAVPMLAIASSIRDAVAKANVLHKNTRKSFEKRIRVIF